MWRQMIEPAMTAYCVRLASSIKPLVQRACSRRPSFSNLKVMPPLKLCKASLLLANGISWPTSLAPRRFAWRTLGAASS